MKTITTILITLSLLIFCTVSARANPEICRTADGFLDNGIGGTGHEGKKGGGDDGKGIGGTGAPFEAAYITGTIYAYGSICVNGLRIAYDPETPVNQNGKISRAEDLNIGQVVTVYADNKNGLKAVSIDARYDIEGPVTGIDETKSIVHIMNTPVAISGPGELQRISRGKTVSVSGMTQKDGVIAASFVTQKPDFVPDSISGVVRQDAGGQQWIGGTAVAFASKDQKKNLLNKSIQVKGRWDGNKLVVSHVAPVHRLPSVRSENVYFSFEGYLNTVGPGKQVILGGLAMNPQTLTCGDGPLEEGERMIGMGTLTPHGKITIDGFEDVPVPATKVILP